MSSKLLNALTGGDNSDLQKQIGCMTGIFHQVFDLHHVLPGRRPAGYEKRLLSGPAYTRSNPSTERKLRNEYSPSIVLERNNSKSFGENQRVASMESSRTSFSSSSRSSSFSSLECNKSIQEPPPLDQIVFQDRIFQSRSKSNSRCETPYDLHDVLAQPGRHSLDFREVVKDSINKGASGLSVKTSSKEDLKNHASKQNDSVGFLSQLKEAPWNIPEPGEHPRLSYEAKGTSSYYGSAYKETPRFSYDGRESSYIRMDSRENGKSAATRLREPPRLSLDSRQGSSRSCSLNLMLDSILGDSERIETEKDILLSSSALREGGGHKRHSSVVAKLMGLEVMPSSFGPAKENPGDLSTIPMEREIDPRNGQKGTELLPKSAKGGVQVHVSGSPKNLHREATEPRPRSSHQSMKAITLPKVPIEIAPWRQQDEFRTPKKTTFRHREALMKHSESIFREIEKRPQELKFRQSGKDLIALKHILDSMQEQGILEAKVREDHPFSSQLRKSYIHQNAQNLSSSKSRTELVRHTLFAPLKGSTPGRAFEAPIVVMKPAKSIGKSAATASAIIPLGRLPGLQKHRTGDSIERSRAHISDITYRDTKSSSKREEIVSRRSSSRTAQSLSRPQQSARDGGGATVKTSNSLSPRLHQRKLELDKNLQSLVASPESSRIRRQPTNKTNSDSVSPRVIKTRSKAAQMQQKPEQPSEISSNAGTLFHHGDEISIRSDSNISYASQSETEVTSTDRFAEITPVSSRQGNRRPSGRSANNAATTSKQKKPSTTLKEEASAIEPPSATTEQPSPISVLDPSFYEDDLPPSPVKRTPDFKDVSVSFLPNSAPPKTRADMNHKKLESIEILVEKLSQLSAGDGEEADGTTTDHISSLCETRNPDHRYVSEILLASGLLLKDLDSAGSIAGPANIQLHPSGHPINPDLFHVLEQTKSGLLSKLEPASDQNKPDPGKLRRKLVFDLVNEALVQKLELAVMHSIPNIRLLGPRRPSSGSFFPSGQCLLRSLCSEVDQLEVERFKAASSIEGDSAMAEELLRGSEGWEGFGGDISGVVLEVERSIFKELIHEVVVCWGAAAGSSSLQQSKLRRKLFVN